MNPREQYIRSGPEELPKKCLNKELSAPKFSKRGLERKASKGLEEFLEVVRLFCSFPCRASLISST